MLWKGSPPCGQTTLRASRCGEDHLDGKQGDGFAEILISLIYEWQASRQVQVILLINTMAKKHNKVIRDESYFLAWFLNSKNYWRIAGFSKVSLDAENPCQSDSHFIFPSLA